MLMYQRWDGGVLCKFHRTELAPVITVKLKLWNAHAKHTSQQNCKYWLIEPIQLKFTTKIWNNCDGGSEKEQLGTLKQSGGGVSTTWWPAHKFWRESVLTRGSLRPSTGHQSSGNSGALDTLVTMQLQCAVSGHRPTPERRSGFNLQLN